MHFTQSRRPFPASRQHLPARARAPQLRYKVRWSLFHNDDINDGETARQGIPAIVRSVLAYPIALCFSVEVYELTAIWNEADNDGEENYDRDDDDDDKIPFN